MKTIYLVRHSKAIKDSFLTFENDLNDQEKNEKIPLSVEGEELASQLASTLFNSNIDYLWSSTYERAISTAKYIAKQNNININITDLFNERKLGDTKNIKDDFWLTQLKDQNAAAPEGESQKEVRTRMITGLQNVLNNIEDNTQTVIVTHATAMTFLLMHWCVLLDATLEGKKRWLTFKGVDVINDSFKTPEVFKLEFDNNDLINIVRLSI